MTLNKDAELCFAGGGQVRLFNALRDGTWKMMGLRKPPQTPKLHPYNQLNDNRGDAGEMVPCGWVLSTRIMVERSPFCRPPLSTINHVAANNRLWASLGAFPEQRWVYERLFHGFGEI